MILILMRTEVQVRKYKGTYRIKLALDLQRQSNRGNMILHRDIPEGKNKVGNCLDVKHGESDEQIQVDFCPPGLCCLYISF